MNLAAFTSEKRAATFEALNQGHPPPEGAYDEGLFKEARDKGKPQMGTTRYTPDSIIVEFIYPIADTAPLVLSVRYPAPERVVYMPVPKWVVESVWQGDVTGSYRFQSEARDMLQEFEALLEAEPNAKLFGEKAPIGRP